MSNNSPATLSRCIENHRAAKAAWYAQPEDVRNSDDDPAFDAMCDAARELETMPTASDGEFIRKLAYLFTDATDNNGEVVAGGDFGSVLVAMALRFNPDSATAQA